MNRRIALLVAIALASTAAVSRTAAAQTTPAPVTPPPAADSVANVDPVGTYAIDLPMQGNTLALTTKIEKKADGTYGGTVNAEGIPELPINSVKVTGKSIRVSIAVPDGSEAVMTLVLDGNQVSGEVTQSGQSTGVTGKKLP
jgi:hypothetical protein